MKSDWLSWATLLYALGIINIQTDKGDETEGFDKEGAKRLFIV